MVVIAETNARYFKEFSTTHGGKSAIEWNGVHYIFFIDESQTGCGATNYRGAYRYSVDNGATWTVVYFACVSPECRGIYVEFWNSTTLWLIYSHDNYAFVRTASQNTNKTLSFTGEVVSMACVTGTVNGYQFTRTKNRMYWFQSNYDDPHYRMRVRYSTGRTTQQHAILDCIHTECCSDGYAPAKRMFKNPLSDDDDIIIVCKRWQHDYIVDKRYDASNDTWTDWTVANAGWTVAGLQYYNFGGVYIDTLDEYWFFFCQFGVLSNSIYRAIFSGATQTWSSETLHVGSGIDQMWRSFHCINYGEKVWVSRILLDAGGTPSYALYVDKYDGAWDMGFYIDTSKEYAFGSIYHQGCYYNGIQRICMALAELSVAPEELYFIGDIDVEFNPCGSLIGPYTAKRWRTQITYGGTTYTLGVVEMTKMTIGRQGGVEPKYGKKMPSDELPANRHKIGMKRIYFTIRRWLKTDELESQHGLLFDLNNNETEFQLAEFIKDTGEENVILGIILLQCVVYDWKLVTGASNDIVSEEAQGYALDWKKYEETT